MDKARLLITGANGFIGSFLAEKALLGGFDVYAGVRKNSNVSALSNLNISLVFLDYVNTEELSAIFKQYNFTHIIHNAGLTRTIVVQDYFKVNKDYLVNIISAVRSSNIQLSKFVFISSLAAFGPADFQESGIVKTNSIPHPVTNYGKSKIEAERYLTKQTDIPYIIIRPTAVYGPREKDLLNVFQLLNKRIEMYAGLIPQKLTFIYVKDLVDVIILSLTSAIEKKAYFVTDGNVYTGEAFNGFIKESLNKRTLKLRLPIFLLQIVAFVLEKVTGFWDEYPPLNIDKVNEIKARNWNCDIQDLKNDFGFIAKYDLTKGIPETVAWYKEHKWL